LGPCPSVLDLGLLEESGATLGSHVLGLLLLTQILDPPEAASVEEIERAVTHMYTVGFVLNVSVSASHVTSSCDCGNFCRSI